MRDGARGFSLIEVVVALGLLAGVLISIAGLFVIGGRQVKAGRSSTEALSVARGIVEQMNKWGFRQTYELFGVDGTDTTYTIDTRAITDPPTTGMAKWQPLLEDKIPGAWGEIEVESLADPALGALPALEDAKAIRVIVTIHWAEGLRQREIQLATVRM
jgi:type II secretory pathway pseudopilin PulG